MHLYKVTHTIDGIARSTNQLYMDLPFTSPHDQKWPFNSLCQAALCLDHPLIMLLLLIVPDLHCHLYILGFRLDEMHQSCCKPFSAAAGHLVQFQQGKLTHCTDQRTLKHLRNF